MAPMPPLLTPPPVLAAELPTMVQLVRLLAPVVLPPYTPPPKDVAVLLTTRQLTRVQALAPPPLAAAFPMSSQLMSVDRYAPPPRLLVARLLMSTQLVTVQLPEEME